MSNPISFRVNAVSKTGIKTSGPEQHEFRLIHIKAHPQLTGFSSFVEFEGEKYRLIKYVGGLDKDEDGTLNHQYHAVAVVDEADYEKSHEKFTGPMCRREATKV